MSNKRNKSGAMIMCEYHGLAPLKNGVPAKRKTLKNCGELSSVSSILGTKLDSAERRIDVGGSFVLPAGAPSTRSSQWWWRWARTNRPIESRRWFKPHHPCHTATPMIMRGHQRHWSHT